MLCCTGDTSFKKKNKSKTRMGMSQLQLFCTLATENNLLQINCVKFERSELAFTSHIGKVFSRKMSYVSAPRWYIQDTHVMCTPMDVYV